MPGAPLDPPKMPLARRLLIEISVGAALGFLVWSLTGPSVMAWWYEPPSKDAFSCAGSVRNALSQFVVFELVAATAGGVLLTLFLFLMRRLLSPKDS